MSKKSSGKCNKLLMKESEFINRQLLPTVVK